MNVNPNPFMYPVSIGTNPYQSIQFSANSQEQKKVEQGVGQTIIELSKPKIEIEKTLYDISLNNFAKCYPCLEKENRLTQEEKISLMQYPEEIVKEAIELVAHRMLNKPLSEQIKIYCNAKVNPKPPFWKSHKTKILSTISVLAICIIAATCINLYDKTYWIYAADGGKCPLPNPNDKFNRYMCIENKWHKAAYIPIIGLEERQNACAGGVAITGCIEGKYFHNLSKECLKNPNGFSC